MCFGRPEDDDIENSVQGDTCLPYPPVPAPPGLNVPDQAVDEDDSVERWGWDTPSVPCLNIAVSAVLEASSSEYDNTEDESLDGDSELEESHLGGLEAWALISSASMAKSTS